MKHILFVAILFCVPWSFLRAQLSDETYSAGLTVGATASMHGFFKGSQISGLPQTIIPDVYINTTYNTREVHQGGFSSGMFFSRRFQNPYWLGVQIDLFFSQHTGGFDYDDILGLTYQMRFKYWYGNVMPGLKVYPGLIFSYGDEHWWTGFYGRLGLYSGINLKAHNVTYDHQPADIYGESDAVELELKKITNGKADFGFTAGIGYEKEVAEWGGFIGELRYCRGSADVVEVKQNSYGFRSDIDNNIRTLQITLGIAFYLNQ